MNAASHDNERKPPPKTVVSTQTGYDRWSEIYDEEFNALVQLEEPAVRARLGDVAGLDVIDLGSGTGRHAVWLVEHRANVTAVEFSQGMIAKARAKPGWDRVRLVDHDLTTPVPLPDASFDRVLNCLVLDHIFDLPHVFAEFRRLCRPDGFIVTSIMHPAMMLRGVQAHFTDPRTGDDIHPRSAPNQISDYVLAALGVGLQIEHMSEHAVDEQLAARSPRAAKYLGWPLLLLMQLRP